MNSHLRDIKNQPKLVKTYSYDRFIPNRNSMDSEICSYLLTKKDSPTKESNFSNLLAANLLEEQAERTRILSFSQKAPARLEMNCTMGLKLSRVPTVQKETQVSSRHIPSAPFKILDAPGLIDDYYINLLDWGKNNMLAIALGDAVYLWNAISGTIQELLNFDEQDYVTAVSWMDDGRHIGIGTNKSVVQIWDSETGRKVRSMTGHTDTVGVMSWNGHILSTGSKDTTIINHDTRIKQHKISLLQGHTQQVCGLKWSPDGSVLASGGNDNKVCIWDVQSSQQLSSGYKTVSPKFELKEHKAAVRALAWCPWKRNLLATGGGSADQTIKFWNTMSGKLVNTIETDSQVCSLQWSKRDQEILSSHGHTKNQICIWNYNTLKKVKELNGHSARVLHTSLSPDGTTVVSAGGDETLRFWKVFSAPEKKKSLTNNTLTCMMGIR